MDYKKAYEELTQQVEHEIKKLNKHLDELKNKILNDNGVPEIITLKEASKLLNISLQAIDLKRRKGEILTVSKGHRIYIEREELNKHLEIRNKVLPSKPFSKIEKKTQKRGRPLLPRDDKGRIIRTKKV